MGCKQDVKKNRPACAGAGSSVCGAESGAELSVFGRDEECAGEDRAIESIKVVSALMRQLS